MQMRVAGFGVFLAASLILCSTPVQGVFYCASFDGPSVYSVGGLYEDMGCDAFGEFNRTLNVTGWNVLRVTSNASIPDERQAYMTGFFEGFVTAEDIVNFHENTLGDHGSFGPVNPTIRRWIRENDDWMKNQSAMHRQADEKWAHVALMLHQIQGMLDGIAAAGYTMSREQFLISLAMPDVVSDLQVIYTDPQTAKVPRLQRLHCSSIVKVRDDLGDLFFGHTTWMNFNTMLRVFKTITLNFQSVNISGRTTHFSSYPGQIASTDDFYAVSSGLGVMETSFSIYNLSIYNGHLTPQSLLTSIRSTLANRLADSGPAWADAFGFHNSGTYNNQWIVVDMKRFQPGRSLAPGTLTIVEQLPGVIESSDQTEALSFGYWPSYNVPISRRLYYLAGYGSRAAANDQAFNSYQNTVRAQLFRQLQGRVQSIEEMQWLLQYNQYQTNPLEQGNPVFAIAARGDLVTFNPQGFGGLDCKVASFKEFMTNGTVRAFSGPTPQQAVFSFLTSNATGLSPHAGLPLTFNFTWQRYSTRD